MPLHMRLPKLKGFTNRFRTEYQVVNLDRIAALFPQGGTIGVDDLVAAGAVRGDSLVKVLGDGEIDVSPSRSPRTSSPAPPPARSPPRAAAPPRCSTSHAPRVVGPVGSTTRSRLVRLLQSSPRLGRRPTDVSHARPAPAPPHLTASPTVPPAPARRPAAGPPTRSVPRTDGRQEDPCSPPSVGPSRLPTCAGRSCSRCSSSGVPARRVRPRARRLLRRHPGRPRVHRGQQPLRAGQPVQRRSAAAAVGLRARDHAVHHGVDHPAAARRGHPTARGAEEGGPVRPGQDHAVHALPDGRAGGAAVDRHHRARPLRPAVPRPEHRRHPRRLAVPHPRPGHHDDRRHGRRSCGSASSSPTAASATACRC